MPRQSGSLTSSEIASSRSGPGEISLVESFADQAVIAIENARLFEELEQRNQQVSEALEQQTAFGEVLRIIASSPANAQPVLDALLESAGRLSDSKQMVIGLRDGDQIRIAAAVGTLGSIPIRRIGGSAPLARRFVPARCTA